MTEGNNFLLGRGELLTGPTEVVRASGAKKPPYSAAEAISRASEFLTETSKAFDDLPIDACPNDQVIATVTLHPRFISKSDFPTELLAKAGLRAVGGKAEFITPKQWGVEKHPEGAVTDTLFVSTTRGLIHEWIDGLESWDENDKAMLQLQRIELIGAPTRETKLKGITDRPEAKVFEAVLHTTGDSDILDSFYAFLETRDAVPNKNRARPAKGLVFVPFEADASRIADLADFSFIRALRPMPQLRTFRPPVIRSDPASLPLLPEPGKALSDTRVAIFDGGIPDDSPVLPWVNYIEPGSIGNPVPAATAHGEQVTSAFLFGHLTPKSNIESPYARVDHIRVIDDQTGKGGDYDLYDVLDRITFQLDLAEERYEYVNLSLGPDLPVEDDEITAWTAELDQRASNGVTLFSVAAGNSGERDATTRLNRIQPPSDGVNLLAVGACDSLDDVWARCSYSSIGPGRTPGVAKPDGVAFGGAFERPFGVISTDPSVGIPGLNGTQGTSFSAPLTLRTATGLQALAGDELEPLAVRALLVHHAENGGHPAEEVGWGRFPDNPMSLITCEDDEITVVYQGELPLKKFLRAPIPLPTTPLTGNVSIKATLVIAPEVDPAFAHAYTRAGLEVVFRPNAKRKDSEKTHADSDTFFSASNLYKAAEYQLRSDGHKWEPCWRAEKTKRGSLLENPCFDIYYHNRDEGQTDTKPHPLHYALVVTIRAPKVTTLYEDTLKLYSEILVPIKPTIEVPISLET